MGYGLTQTSGTRLQSVEAAVTTEYTANIVNRYPAVGAEQPSYDLDGNQLTGSDWEFGWSEENRLAEAVNGMEKLEFSYDYLGRRLTKKVWQGETLTQSLKFVYDNYKLIAVLDALADDAVMLTFVWQPAGLDVPLMMTYDSERYFYVTDGNKNVIALYDIDGILMASYSYGPFGQLLSAEGPLAQINPLRFSSEYFDDETGLVYYNHRYYSPRLGRWLSRDPIGEEGGLNLYGMLGNDAVSSWDKLGLEDHSQWDPLKPIPSNPSEVNYPVLPILDDIDAESLKKVLQMLLGGWYIKMRPEMEDKFKSLCQRLNENDKKACEQEGTALANKIIDNIGMAIKVIIDKFNRWPVGGDLGNIYAASNGPGYKCDQWSDFVDNAVNRRSGKYFKIAQEISWHWTSRHSWTSVRGLCSADKNKGDFGIDFWPSGGWSNDYTIKSSYLRNEFP